MLFPSPAVWLLGAKVTIDNLAPWGQAVQGYLGPTLERIINMPHVDFDALTSLYSRADLFEHYPACYPVANPEDRFFSKSDPYVTRHFTIIAINVKIGMPMGKWLFSHTGTMYIGSCFNALKLMVKDSSSYIYYLVIF